MPNGQFDAWDESDYEELSIMDWMSIMSNPEAYPEGMLDAMPDWVAEAIEELREEEDEEPTTDPGA